MRQLKLDAFVVRGKVIEQPLTLQRRNSVEAERSVLQAYAEYDDVDQNVYVCRPRRKPTMEGIWYCQCEPLADWSLSCGTSCENRASQTECVKGHCATRYKCGNQRMQQGVHAALALKSIPGKGIALVADMPIQKEELVAQYVGEVLTMEMYLERELKETSRYKHTYGMAVTGEEVIDARRIGGMARFANHSCSPNCTVDRWEVAGETCCGLFAKDNISKGEEITINYGGEFVQTEQQLKCLCGATTCKGYL